MLGLGFVYTVAGLLFGAWSLLTLVDRGHPRRVTSAAFWGLLALSFLAGDALGDRGNGLLVLALVGLGGFGLVGRAAPPTTSDAEREASAARHGNRLLLPALIVPAVALVGTLAASRLDFIDPKQVTLVCLAAGAVIAVVVTSIWLRPPPLAALHEGRRLASQIGWAIILPPMLASLGAVFALAGVGQIIGGMVGGLIPDGARFIAVAVFTLGMAGFTIVMGNAFAAFPVMMAAVGLPVLVVALGGNPAIVAAIGMLSGFCGTLLTPMAANFNIVPAAILELPDRNAVIRVQAPTAIILLAFNTALMALTVYPR